MKITISDIQIDTSNSDYEDCFDLSDIVYKAISDARCSVQRELEETIKREFISDDFVRDYIKRKTLEMQESFKEDKNG